MIKITFCPTCGSDQIKKVRRNWTGTVRKEAITVPRLEYYDCAGCGEKLYDRAAIQEIEGFRSSTLLKRARKTARKVVSKHLN